jgi:endonuclease YncB( thermonuclease family)
MRRRRRPLRPTTQIRFWPQQRRSGLRSLGTLRTLVLAALALLIWPTMDPALIEAPAFLSSEPETVDESFGRCGVDRGHACVVDGDTFRLGHRRVRIVGIDASEVEGQCESERTLAAAATVKLQSLLNEGPFVMTGRLDDMKDRYGRDLRVLDRRLPDGTTQSIASEMRGSGLARRYVGRKLSWC